MFWDCDDTRPTSGTLALVLHLKMAPREGKFESKKLPCIPEPVLGQTPTAGEPSLVNMQP